MYELLHRFFHKAEAWPPPPFVPLPALCSGFAFTSARRGLGVGCMSLGKH